VAEIVWRMRVLSVQELAYIRYPLWWHGSVDFLVKNLEKLNKQVGDNDVA
jgi:hypothetical protein